MENKETVIISNIRYIDLDKGEGRMGEDYYFGWFTGNKSITEALKNTFINDVPSAFIVETHNEAYNNYLIKYLF